MSDKHLLFYSSERCEYSNLFIKKIKDENLLGEFKLIDILELHRKQQKIPPEITNTPTVIVKNMLKPLTGKDAFDWLDTLKYFYQKTNNITLPVKKVIVTNNNNDYAEGVDLKKNEEFANIKDDDDEKNTIKKYNGATQNILITGEQIKQPIVEQKMSSDIQNKKLHELLQLRKIQMAKYK